MDEFSAAAPLDVEVRTPGVRHTVTVAQILKWTQAGGNTPAETLRKKKVADLLQPQQKPQRTRT